LNLSPKDNRTPFKKKKKKCNLTTGISKMKATATSGLPQPYFQEVNTISTYTLSYF